MSIPGLTPELPLRAKVRIGIRQQAQNKKGETYERPASVDYFVCEDTEFEPLVGPRPKSLRIVFPYKTVAECFPTGLEKWSVARSGRPLLLCYTKGDGHAHGLGGHLDADGVTTLDPAKDRQAFPCRAQECRYYGKEKHQGCRPQGRLNFFLVGQRARDSVYRWETKALSSIEQIEAVLAQYPDLRGIEFELRVEKVKRGNKEFPVVSIREVAAPSQPPSADRAGSGAVDYRAECKALLESLDQWPPSEATVAWIKKVGYEAAAKKLALRVTGAA